MKANQKKLYIIISFLIIFIPFGLFPFFVKKNTNDIFEMDKRNITEFSAIMASENAFISAESWISDRLILRKEIISACANLNYKMNVSCRPDDVVLGKDGWLFLGNNYNDTIDQYRKRATYPDWLISQSVETMMKTEEDFKQRDITLLSIMAPNKNVIYHEKMPIWLTKSSKPSFIDRFNESGGAGLIFDLTDVLLDSKQEYGEYLYQRSDSHWSELGAYISYEEVMRKFEETAGEAYIKLELLSYDVEPADGYEIDKVLGLANYNKDYKLSLSYKNGSEFKKEFLTDETNWNSACKYTNKNALNQKSLLILGDSFSIHLIPLFAQTFVEVYFVSVDESFTVLSAEQLVRQLIDESGMDIVLIESVERAISYRLAHLSYWE